MDLDPRLAAHAASFWGWSDDDDDRAPSAASAIEHDTSPDSDGLLDCDGDEASTLVSRNHTIDDMRSDDDEDEDVDDDDDSDASSASQLSGDGDQDPGLPVKRTASAAAAAANRRPVAPQVVVFDDPMGKGRRSTAASYGDFKSFMSSKVSKVTAKPPPPPPMTDAEREEELELARQDRELDDLLKTSKLIEQVAAEELTGRDRRKYQLYKMEELGMTKVKAKMPLPEYLHIAERDKKREARALQFATEAGLDVGSVKRGMTTATALARNVMDKKTSSFDKVISFAEFGKKKEAGKRGGEGGKKRERGLKGTNLGRFKDGMLVLSKQDIRKVQGGGVGKKKGGSSGSGGGGGKVKVKRK